MSSMSRRSFVTASAALIAGTALHGKAHSAPVIHGFDQTKTITTTQTWKPYSVPQVGLRRRRKRDVVCGPHAAVAQLPINR